MSIEKAYLKDTVQTNGILLETINEVLVKAKKEPLADNETLTKVLGLTVHQFERLEKTLHEKTIRKVETDVADALVAGKGVEFKDIALFYVQKSTKRLNKLDKPSERLAIKNRVAFKNRINK
jgi:nucleoid DNA-binding protein